MIIISIVLVAITLTDGTDYSPPVSASIIILC